MLGRLRADPWRRRAAWSRGIGIVLLLIAFFVPLPSAALLAVAAPGLALFLFGALAWLVRTEEPWLRRGA
jgi:hypothetical protein